MWFADHQLPACNDTQWVAPGISPYLAGYSMAVSGRASGSVAYPIYNSRSIPEFPSIESQSSGEEHGHSY
jgi:hypothetical protein